MGVINFHSSSGEYGEECEGIESVYRDTRWLRVEALLRNIKDIPGEIVLSFSVTDKFPNYYLAKKGGLALECNCGLSERDCDCWYDDKIISSKERWEYSIRGIRERYKGVNEFCPETWDNYFFEKRVDVWEYIKSIEGVEINEL